MYNLSIYLFRSVDLFLILRGWIFGEERRRRILKERFHHTKRLKKEVGLQLVPLRRTGLPGIKSMLSVEADRAEIA